MWKTKLKQASSLAVTVFCRLLLSVGPWICFLYHWPATSAWLVAERRTWRNEVSGVRHTCTAAKTAGTADSPRTVSCVRHAMPASQHLPWASHQADNTQRGHSFLQTYQIEDTSPSTQRPACGGAAAWAGLVSEPVFQRWGNETQRAGDHGRKTSDGDHKLSHYSSPAVPGGHVEHLTRQ